MNLGRSQRSGAVVEPMLSTQWFVSMKPLAGPALAAVEHDFTRFVPKQWENTYFAWLRDIRDWCISRQLWWGHRIPAWYCADCATTSTSRAGASRRPAPRPVGSDLTLSKIRTCSTRGFRRRCGRSRCSAGPSQDRGSRPLLPDQRADHRLRHHLLLGRPHDVRRAALHGARAVPRRLHPCPGPRQQGPEDERRRRATSSIRSRSSTAWGADAFRFTLVATSPPRGATSSGTRSAGRGATHQLPPPRSGRRSATASSTATWSWHPGAGRTTRGSR